MNMAMKDRLATYFAGVRADVKSFDTLFKTTIGGIHKSW